MELQLSASPQAVALLSTVPVNTESFTADTVPALIASTSYLYDALNRPWKQTDSRTDDRQAICAAVHTSERFAIR